MGRRDRAAASTELEDDPSREPQPLGPGEEDRELRQLRDTLIGVVKDLQRQKVQTDRLVEKLDAKDAELTDARREATELARSLGEREQEVARLRDQVDWLIGRRERTPPYGQPAPPTDSTRRLEP